LIVPNVSLQLRHTIFSRRRTIICGSFHRGPP
jgi:hypothetical protein